MKIGQVGVWFCSIQHNWGKWKEAELTYSNGTKRIKGQMRECERCGAREARRLSDPV